MVDAARLADEYAVLYKPLKFEQANSPKSKHRAFAARSDKYVGRGNSQQNFKAKGTITKQLVQNWTAPDVFCIKCDQASVCRSKWSSTHKLLEPEPPTVIQLGQHPNSNAKPIGPRVLHKQFEPFCALTILYTKEGARRLVVWLRGSGAL